MKRVLMQFVLATGLVAAAAPAAAAHDWTPLKFLCPSSGDCSVSVTVTQEPDGSCKVTAPKKIVLGHKPQRIVWTLPAGSPFVFERSRNPKLDGISFSIGPDGDDVDADDDATEVRSVAKRARGVRDTVRYRFLLKPATGPGSCSEGGPVIVNRD